MRLGQSMATSRSLAIVVPLLGFAALLSSCSTLPKQVPGVVAIKNEAAEYSSLADGFLADGQYASALQYYGEALDSNLSVDNVEGGIVSRASLGKVYLALGSMEDAERELGDALEDARMYGKPGLVALCLSNLGELRYASGDVSAAESLFVEAEPLAADDEAVAAVVAHNRGIVAMARGELDTAEAFILKAVEANEKASRWVELGSNQYALASIANSRGNLPLAIEWATKALESDKTAENSPGIAADLEALAKLEIKSGNDMAAFNLYRRAFGVWLSLNRAVEAERSLVALNELATKLGKESYAVRYAALLERIRGE